MLKAALLFPSQWYWQDYLELCKPKVVALMLLTVVIGMCLATPGMIPWQILVLGNLGIALCAGAAAVVNHIVDRSIDQKMARTFSRPVASGRVSPSSALIFALLLACVGQTLLLLAVNALCALLTLISLLGYAVVYTLFLKRASPQNIVIGGLAGAAPPLLGWTAVTGTIEGHGLLLVLIIFAWTPPHFWALAVHRKKEYQNAKIPMLPVTHGCHYTKVHIFLYTLILTLVSLLPFACGMLSWIYLSAALALNVVFIIYAALMLWDSSRQWGMATFKYSIVYLLLLFVAMLVDHYSLPAGVFKAPAYF